MLIFTRLAGFVSFGSLDGSSTIKTCAIETVSFFQSLSCWICLDLSGFVLVCLGGCPTQSFVHFAVFTCQLCFITNPYWVIWKKQSRAICWVCLACNCSSSQQGFNEIKASLKFFLTKCWLERQDGKKTPHTIHELASAQNFSDLLADQLSSYGGAQLTIQSSPYRPL